MVAIPVLIYGTTVALGIVMLWRHLTDRPRLPVVGGFHFIIGAAGLEVLALILRRAPAGDSLALFGDGRTVGLALAATLLVGIAVPIIAQARGWGTGVMRLVWVHAGLGTLAFGLVLVWALRN